jgi:hypothetical protein
MATDKPITGFDVLDAADVEQDDILVIVDVHDTDQSPSGSTKQVTLAAIFSAFTDLVLTTLTVSGLSSLVDVTASGLSTFNKIKGGGSAPSVVATGGSASITGTDTAGVISFTPSADRSFINLVVTFSTAYTTAPIGVACITGNNIPTTPCIVQTVLTTNGITVAITAPTAVFLNGTPYKFAYHVIA